MPTLLLMRNPIHVYFISIKLGKEALDNIVVSMSNNEGGLHPFIATHKDTSGTNTVEKGDNFYSRKHTVKAERGRFMNGVEFFQGLHVQESAFLHFCI